VSAPIEHTSPVPSAAVLEPFAGGGRALMLGHVHPDADVLGTLLALGLALEARSWSVVYGGPHPSPDLLAFLPGVDRYRTLDRVDGRFDVVVLTDCPNPQRTEGLIDQARSAGKVVVNIDHHPDNRRYGHVNWIDVTAAATGEMVYELLTAMRVPLTPAIATNLYTAIHTDTGSFRYSNVTTRTFTIAAALLRELNGTVKVSLRGKGDVDVQKIAAQFGGGGHVNAAGCTVAGPLPEATRLLLAAVRRAVDAKGSS
jgi:nanoRNase/pAp phosphatase (c-di-AMP/oligoRNAs hydrolase)